MNLRNLIIMIAVASSVAACGIGSRPYTYADADYRVNWKKHALKPDLGE